MVSSLHLGDRVLIGREQDNEVTGEGEVIKASPLAVKVAVGANVITFYGTGLERAAPRGVSRGLRVIVGPAGLIGRAAG
jgi:uncharacterized protein YaaW (UPF0174 family)